jgi:hypothetical protein
MTASQQDPSNKKDGCNFDSQNTATWMLAAVRPCGSNSLKAILWNRKMVSSGGQIGAARTLSNENPVQ